MTSDHLRNRGARPFDALKRERMLAEGEAERQARIARIADLREAERAGEAAKRFKHCWPDLWERIDGVTIESKSAMAVMRQYDGNETLHYVDPPYHPETRSTGNRRRVGPGSAPWQVYKHELDHDGHVDLLETLIDLKGMVALSAYPHPLYDDALREWSRIERAAYADGGAPRVEVLYLNPRLSAAIHDGPLFEYAA